MTEHYNTTQTTHWFQKTQSLHNVNCLQEKTVIRSKLWEPEELRLEPGQGKFEQNKRKSAVLQAKLQILQEQFWKQIIKWSLVSFQNRNGSQTAASRPANRSAGWHRRRQNFLSMVEERRLDELKTCYRPTSVIWNKWCARASRPE